MQRSVRELDGGVVVFDSVQGVEPQSETVWRQADKFGVPRICFSNKMDRTGASYERTIESIRERLGANALQMQLAIGSESNFSGVVNLLEENAVIYNEASGSTPEFVDIPEEYKAEAAEKRALLVERIAELDEELTERFLEGEDISLAELKLALRKAVIANQASPVFGSSLKNKGVQLVLDAVIDYLPSPLDIPP